MSTVNLSALPEISFAPLDSASVEASIFAAYERLSGTTLYPGDPVRLFLESLAWAASVENRLIDQAGKQNLLAYAQGAHLDHLGALMGVARIPAQPARCVIRFYLAQSLDFAVPVPKNSRVATRDGKAIFATQITAQIPAGELYVDIPALCQQAGLSGSGLLAGQINVMIDPLPYISTIANIDTSTDGSDIEDDERLRERIRIAPESFTVAGSSGEYVARTLAVSAEISEVSITSPEPGVVDVRFVLQNGALPDQALCDQVLAALNAETVRTLTDKVLVGAPDLVSYSISGQWYAKREDETILSIIMANVAKALEEYRIWQRSKPGRDIVPSRLIELIQAAGAKRVQIEQPAFTPISGTQIAREISVSLAFGGMEDE